VRIPVTIVNEGEPPPTCSLSAAIHSDDLNGIEVGKEVVDEWDHDDTHGCVVGLPVLNVPCVITQERHSTHEYRSPLRLTGTETIRKNALSRGVLGSTFFLIHIEFYLYA